MGEVNETTVLVEGQEARALKDSGFQLSFISLAWVKKLNLNPQQLWSVLQIEGSGGLDVPYLGYVETHLGEPEVKGFDTDVLLLIVPDSVHTMHIPITLGTLHIDMAINNNQIDYEGGTSGEPKRCTNSVSGRQHCEKYQRYNNYTIWNH